MPEGYCGRYLIVDLSSGAQQVIDPPEDFYRRFLGGYGLGAAVLAERQPPGIDALGPENHLGFCTGLLAGTGALFAGRYVVVGKSPLTGGWGDANSGGYFARELKRTGFDAVFFTGAAPEPVWALVTEDGVALRDARHLWGRDTVDTERLIREALGDAKVQVAAIGEGGERRSLISGIATDGGRLAARSGLGAVMGSKQLKAVAVRGRRSTPVADPQAMRRINREFLRDYRRSRWLDRLTVRFMNPLSRLIALTGVSVPAGPSLLREILGRYGTAGLTVYSAMTGDMPIRNWAGVGLRDWGAQSAEKNSDRAVLHHQRRKYACQSCPLACGGLIDIPAGRYAGTTGHRPEYETLASFGGLLLHDDLPAIIELNEMCNRAGLDTISAGATVAFAIECFQNGVIDTRDTGGLVLDWGRTEAIRELVERMIRREGIGDLLADGVRAAAAAIGRGAERFAVHAGGQELPMHDPRLDPGYAIAYQCEPTPGRHTVSSYLYAELFGVHKRFGRARRMIAGAEGRRAQKVARCAAGAVYMQLVNAAGLCLFGAMTSALPVVEWLNAATGWELAADDYFTTGERILNLRKAFNLREGLGPADHRLSGRALGEPPLDGGPLKGVRVELATLAAEFERLMGWEPSTGGPGPQRLRELGLDQLAAEVPR